MHTPHIYIYIYIAIYLYLHTCICMEASVAMQHRALSLHPPDHLGKPRVVLARSPSLDDNPASPCVLAPVDKVGSASGKLHPLAPVDIWQIGFYTAWERKSAKKKRRNRRTWMWTVFFSSKPSFLPQPHPSFIYTPPPTSLDLPRPALLLQR